MKEIRFTDKIYMKTLILGRSKSLLYLEQWERGNYSALDMVLIDAGMLNTHIVADELFLRGGLGTITLDF